ncbi:MAG: DNA replication and repair protein RecF [Niabella sp.]
MFLLRNLQLFQFKNYPNRSFDFDGRIVSICGSNGVGKTNILDAIHYLCFTKSYFGGSDAANVQHGRIGFRIEGNILLQDNAEKAVCILRETGRKEFSINDEPYSRFSQHIGRYPCVIIAPDDAVLITGGSEGRRSFIDSLLSQIDSTYLKNLIQYNKVLQQRNSFLKSAAESGFLDEALLAVLNEQLATPGTQIFTKRREFLLSFLPKVKRLYTEIAQREEDLVLLYESRLSEAPMASLLEATRQKDALLQRTTVGIHRDELTIQLNGQPFKSTASQGQRKSLLFALKLTELEVIRQEKKFAPILLLDDIFEKLDENRMTNLLQKVCIENEGQVFITDTHATRVTEQLQNIGATFSLINLED